ncbi:MAG TPA: hypothetical protein VGS22_17620 [Thermoanaerobaculia bacterium]|jgi:hypothetical protein|nr:hypothetical protein [Thermoanaerobaculia bacterium]
MPVDRSRSRTTRKFLPFLLGLIALPAVGAEFDRIASFAAGDPRPCADSGPDVAVQPGGSFLLTWQRSQCPEISTLKVRAQRFDAAGRPLTPAFDLWDGIGPQVVPLPNGGFVATSWFERDLGPLLPTGIGLHRLDALGRPSGETIAVAVDPNFGPNADPRLAVAPNGAVAIVWRESSSFLPISLVRGRFYNAALEPVTETLALANDLAQFQVNPDIAFRDDGTALAIWVEAENRAPSQIFGRLFDVSGHPLTDRFPVTTTETDRASLFPRVVARGDGGWWVGWYSFLFQIPFSGDEGASIQARVLRLGVGGERIGVEQSLGAPLTANGNVSPALGIGPRGNLLVLGTGVDGTISGRLFNRDGARASNLFDLSESAPLLFGEPVLVDRSPSGFVAAWSGIPFIVSPGDSDLFGAILNSVCLEGKKAACLGPDGRFGVEVTWQNGAQSGRAKPLPLSGNVATFGLHNAAEHDVTVLLSGSGSRDLTFAATTGAALVIRVTDKTTGMIRTFAKPAGRFASQRIPNALPSLAGDSGDSAVTVSAAVDEAESASIALPAVGETCAPTRRALCLLGGRFRAELLAGQQPRPALALLRTDKSGAFAFPSAPDVPVVTLTMIDGRASNGKFWVYLGGLSPSGYKVRITDLSTGTAQTYSNPAGRLESRADRTAFR